MIGLAPTNAVAEDMRGEGFKHGATVHSELFALNNGRTNWNNRTAVIVDEAAMLDTKLMAMVTAYAHDSGAKLILVGDDRQLSSIDRGGMFGALKDRHGAASLTEVKRQHKIDERRAAEMMAEGNFHDALGIYQDKGAIHWTRTQGEARGELVDQWAKDSATRPDKTRFVFAYTNDDVNQLNAALRAVRKGRGELGQDHELATAHGRHSFAAGDRIQFTATDKRRGIDNGVAGTIEAIDGTHLAVKLDGPEGKVINFDAAAFDKFRHGYAGTIYRGQGKTLDQTYLYHSEHWRSAASYVALTRHRDKAELFVARNTARDVNQLARQMARTDDRRAASQFHHRDDWEPVRPLTADQILAEFGGASFKRDPPARDADFSRCRPARSNATPPGRGAGQGEGGKAGGDGSQAVGQPENSASSKPQRRPSDSLSSVADAIVSPIAALDAFLFGGSSAEPSETGDAPAPEPIAREPEPEAEAERVAGDDEPQRPPDDPTIYDQFSAGSRRRPTTSAALTRNAIAGASDRDELRRAGAALAQRQGQPRLSRLIKPWRLLAAWTTRAIHRPGRDAARTRRRHRPRKPSR